MIIIYLYLAKCYIYLTNIFQQNHYDKIKYFKSLKKYYLKKKYQYFYYLGFIPVILNLSISNLFWISLSLLLVSFIYKNKYIIKLKWTKRIIRLTLTTFLLILIITHFCYNIPYIFYLTPILLPFIILIANYLNKPFEYLISIRYINKAKKKINNLKINQLVAITGSFGKTTTKNILHSVLNNQYLVTKTPKSYNTILGISKTINEDLKYSQDVYIMEMGAFRVGEIRKMANLFKPNIVVVTEIGMQHMSTFKSIENVIKAKFEITEGISKNGQIILNYENEYIRNYKLNANNIYTYGINYGMYQAKNIIIDKNITSFDIYKDNDFCIHIETKLLGRHQVLNVLAVYCVICALRNNNIVVSDEDFKNIILDIKNTNHRLEYKEIGNMRIYDDSYSSNLKGFINACEVLSNQNGKKIIITPGIVDGGKYDEELNKEITSEIVKTFDDIYLINNPSSQKIIEELNKNNIHYYLFSSFKLAYLDILTKYNNKEEVVNLLIENDLPDSFLERS